jgi:signal transduction histidine kinase
VFFTHRKSMASALPATTQGRAGAQHAGDTVTPWQERSLRDLRERESPRYVPRLAQALIAIASAWSFLLFAVNARLAVVHRGAYWLGVRPETALGLTCLGVAAFLLTSPRRDARRVSLGVSWLIALYGVAVLVDPPGSGLGVLRIPANTGLLLACLGLGIAIEQGHTARLRWLADGLVLAGGAIALLAVIATLFGSEPQYPIASRDSMTITTAVIGCVLAAAAILQRTDRGLGKLFDSNASGGVLARRLVPAVLVFPIGIARLTYLGVETGRYDAGVAMSIGILTGVALLIGVTVASARVVDRLDAVRRGNEAQIRQMVGDIAHQSKELARTNTELESFSYSVSHDLRAPIRHIAGFSELLTKVGGDRLDDKIQHYIAMISESAEHAGKLIDDLLEFSRMGRTELKTCEIALDALVRDAWTNLVPERAGRDIELRVGSLPTVKADPAMLGIAIGNLLSNAVKYTARQTRAAIDVAGRDDGDNVVITVRDNGVGFEMKYVDKLFGVFQRLHGDEFEGVGIGLANVKRIVERHGGRVWADGEIDHGASFHFSLPRTKDISA